MQIKPTVLDGDSPASTVVPGQLASCPQSLSQPFSS